MRPFDLFFQFNLKLARTNQQTYLPVEMQFYISVMFLGLPDDIHEEKTPFLQLKKRMTDQPTDGRTDPLIEMQGCA